MADQFIPSEPLGGVSVSLINENNVQWFEVECATVPNSSQLLHALTSLSSGTEMGDFK